MITIIGGGPAGISAALAAAQSGESVRLIEGSSRLGGQYWRHLPEEGSNGWTGQEELHDDFKKGYRLRQEVLRDPNIEVLFDTHVWHAELNSEEIVLSIVQGGVARELAAHVLILATGAYDRSIPFPGWDIPGVMTAGAAQSLLKGSYVRAGKRVVVAGTGPFLLPVASGLLDIGVEIVGLYEANRITRWMPFAHVALANISKVLLARKYTRNFSAHNLAIEYGYCVVQANAGAEDLLYSVIVAQVDRNFRVKPGTERELLCDALAVSWGFTPDFSIAHNLGLDLHIDPDDGSTVLDVNEYQQTSAKRVFAAGEATGIGGSDLAMTEGEIAGIAAAQFLGKSLGRRGEVHLRRLHKKREAERRFARALLRVYRVKPGWINWLTPETLACRCEEVSVGDIQNAVNVLGATNLRSAKLLTRVGMGMCQGRTCSRFTMEIISSETGVAVSEADHFSSGKRPIVTPISLGSIADGSSVEDSHHNQ